MFDVYYLILVLPAIVFAMWAQARVSGAFHTYAKIRPRNGMTGADAARAVLRANDVEGVTIERVPGKLTDHYDPKKNVIRLSEAVYDACSVAAVGVAAHEAGHAAQYAHGYAPIKLRAAIIPVTRFGSFLSWPLILLGIFLNTYSLIYAGILLFACVTVFQLVTLPVEFDASRRAVETLGAGGYLSEDELPGARKTLNAAALTYVAALAVSLMQLLRLLLLFSGGRRRN